MAERKKIGFGTILMVILAVCAVAYVVSTMRTAGDIPYSELRQYFLEEKVQEFSISDTRITAKLKGGSTVTSDLYDFDLFYQDLNELVQKQYDSGIITAYNYHADHSTNWLQLLLPYVLAFLGFILLMNLMNRMAGGGAGAQDKLSRFGEAKVSTPGEKKVTFQDVAGADEEKEELREIVEFLREPQKYLDLGAHIPKGVLLVGPPGTGKTLLAKAVAGEAGVQFLSISGSDFVEMYVGVGASRVRDLFQQAKKSAPAIIFIDEIDAVGRQRGSGLGGGHDEREQTLNQLLVEMDGFGSNEGVVVLAATNRVDILDPALLRPGRFDRQVYVGLPDIKGREEILQVHAKNKPLAEDVDLKQIARGTAGFTGADLENLLNEAALLAGRRSESFITMKDLQESIIKVIAGPEKHSRVIPERERRLTAYHEAGHAGASDHHRSPGRGGRHDHLSAGRGSVVPLPQLYAGPHRRAAGRPGGGAAGAGGYLHRGLQRHQPCHAAGPEDGGHLRNVGAAGQRGLRRRTRRGVHRQVHGPDPALLRENGGGDGRRDPPHHGRRLRPLHHHSGAVPAPAGGGGGVSAGQRDHDGRGVREGIPDGVRH